LNTKGKNSRGFNHSIGIKTLTQELNSSLLWLVIHTKMWIVKKKVAKKKIVVIIIIL
jgi:hypothetical protein